MSSDLQRIIEFILEMDKLKAVLRKTKPAGMERYENSAEHSWQVCLLALLLAKEARPPVDAFRVVELLLIHDIPEIDSGDHLIYESPSEARAEKERLAARRLFGLMPEPQAGWCLSRWEEYRARASREAVFAYAVDRLMPVMHNLKNKGQSWRENRVSFEEVLRVNAVIGEVLPSVWEQVREALGELSARGLFDHGEKNRLNDGRDGQ